MADNPYESPENVGIEQPTNPLPRHDPFPHYIPIAQFALRILGVYIVFVGISNIVEGLVAIYITVVRYNLDAALAEPYWAAAIVGNIVYAVSGGYLALNGRWVIERVFLPSRDETDLSEQTATPEAPGNGDL